MLTIYTHLVGSLHVAAPHTYCWTTPPRYTRRSWRDRVLSHEIRSRVPNCHSHRTQTTESYAQHCLRKFGRFIACGGSTHSLLDHIASIHSQIVARLRFQSRDLISCRPTATLTEHRLPRVICSLFTRIWSVHCVLRLHTLGTIPKHLNLVADPDEIAISVSRLNLDLPTVDR